MVNIKGISAFRPKNPESFVIPPYDVIEKDMEMELKKNDASSVHVILPDGEGNEVYANAKTQMARLIDSEIIVQESKESIYIYRQESESEDFQQEGFILGVSIEDYENGLVKKHEHTREKPLKDRTAHISATQMNTGLVWTTYKATNTIEPIKNKIKAQTPVADFKKFGYRNILWKCDDETIINELKSIFSEMPLYIADGHHRAASAAAYRKKMLEEAGNNSTGNESWNYFMVYVASDDQVRILPYNRVIRKWDMDKDEFFGKISQSFEIEEIAADFKPENKNAIAMFYQNKWIKLTPKQTDFGSAEKNLDVAIVQNLLIDPILGIKDIRHNENIFFVGGVNDPKDMAAFVSEKGNAIFISLYGVKMTEIEEIADANNVMPPKSTWFDPKLLSGLVFNPLK